MHTAAAICRRRVAAVPVHFVELKRALRRRRSQRRIHPLPRTIRPGNVRWAAPLLQRVSQGRHDELTVVRADGVDAAREERRG